MLAKDGNIVYTYGLERAEELKNIQNIINCDNLDNVCKIAEIIIGPIPFSKNGKEINTNFTDTKITVENLLGNVKGQMLIAGAISKEIKDLANSKNIKMVDIMEKEELAILNAISTAEGTIEIAISNTDKIIHGTKCLILGFGRIGKVLAKKLEGLSVNVSCAARKNEDFAWIEANGYNKVDINNIGQNLSEYDIIINTVPHLILDKEKLKHVRKDCLLIDLASKPGGIDFIEAEKQNLRTIWALALPRKDCTSHNCRDYQKHII